MKRSSWGTRSASISNVRLLSLYPRAWRERYEKEFLDLLEERPLTWRDRADVARGALDAHLHPATPSMVPGTAALAGGMLWLAGAFQIVALPAPPDWPGYLMDALPLSMAAVLLLAVATAGCWLRLGDRSGRLGTVGVTLGFAGHLFWAIVLLAVFGGLLYGAPVAFASYVAGLGAILVGLALVRVGDWPIAGLLVAAPVCLLVPNSWGWVAFGSIWAGIGAIELAGLSGSRPIGRAA